MLKLASETTWNLAIVVSIVSVCSAFLGGAASFLTVTRRQRVEHGDVVCERIKRAFENFHGGVLIANRDLMIVWANKQSRAITGYYGDLIGHSVYDLIPEELRDKHRTHVAKFFDDPHTRLMGIAGMPLWLVDRTGRRKAVQISLTPYEDGYGSIEVLVGIQVVKEPIVAPTSS